MSGRFHRIRHGFSQDRGRMGTENRAPFSGIAIDCGCGDIAGAKTETRTT